MNFQNEDLWAPLTKDSDSSQPGISHRNLPFSQVLQMILTRNNVMGGRMEDLQGRKRNRIHVPCPIKSLYFTHINCSDSEAKKSSPKSNIYLCYVRKRRIRMVLLLYLQTFLTTLSSSFDNSVSRPKCLGAISLGLVPLDFHWCWFLVV